MMCIVQKSHATAQNHAESSTSVLTTCTISHLAVTRPLDTANALHQLLCAMPCSDLYCCFPELIPDFPTKKNPFKDDAGKVQPVYRCAATPPGKQQLDGILGAPIVASQSQHSGLCHQAAAAAAIPVDPHVAAFCAANEQTSPCILTLRIL